MKKQVGLDLIQRPGFKLKTVDISSQKIVPLPTQKRISNIDRNIVRRGFMVNEPKARSVPESPALQPIELDDTGKLVTLSDKTVDQLLSITVGDPTDVKWLQEKERLELMFEAQGLTPDQIRRELEVNRPLNREQRTITQKKGVDPDPNIPLARKLDALSNMVLDGRAESRKDQALIAGVMANTMSSIEGMKQLSIAEFVKIGKTIKRINPPVNPEDFGLTARFYDVTNYDIYSGKINFFLMARAQKDPDFEEKDTSSGTLNYNHFIKDFNMRQDGFPTLDVRQFIRKMGKPRGQRRFLDLFRGGLVNLPQMTQIVRANGQTLRDNPEVAVTESHLDGD